MLLLVVDTRNFSSKFSWLVLLLASYVGEDRETLCDSLVRNTIAVYNTVITQVLWLLNSWYGFKPNLPVNLVEHIAVLHWFCLMRSVISLENSHCPFNPVAKVANSWKLKPVVTWLRAFFAHWWLFARIFDSFLEDLHLLFLWFWFYNTHSKCNP